MTQEDKLYQFISKTTHLTPDDFKKISSKITFIDYQKGDFIIKPNQVCSNLCFVVSGIYRVYHIENGKEITSYFNYENRNQFVASFVSLLTGEKSKEYIECISSGTLISIKYSDWQNLYKEIPELNTYGRLMAEYNYVLAMERIEALQYQSAKERYLEFIKVYPQLLNLIPHHYIASYIGVTPESLSRVRKSLSSS